MNKTFFSLLLLSVLGFVGYKYYYKPESLGCHSCSSHESHASDHAATPTGQLITSLITLEDLDMLIAHGKPAFVKVYLDGCPPCNQAATVYPEIAAQFPHIAFYDLNVANSAIMNALIEKRVMDNPITAAPTFLFIKDGKVVEIIQGFNNKESFIAAITPLFNS